jgi:hypothetical protein
MNHRPVYVSQLIIPKKSETTKPPENLEDFQLDPENIGWEATVRISATDITTIVFNVERQKPLKETVNALATEVIKVAYER